MLKWEKGARTYRWANTEFGEYRIMGRPGIRRRLYVESCSRERLDVDLQFRDVPSARAACEADYDRRVAEIALANGYVKLEPGQVVVQTEDLTRIVTWFKGDARTVPHADMDTTLNRFATALDASGVPE